MSDEVKVEGVVDEIVAPKKKRNKKLAEPVAEVETVEVAEVETVEVAEPVAEVETVEVAEPVAEVETVEVAEPVATKPVVETKPEPTSEVDVYKEIKDIAAHTRIAGFGSKLIKKLKSGELTMDEVKIKLTKYCRKNSFLQRIQKL